MTRRRFASIISCVLLLACSSSPEGGWEPRRAAMVEDVRRQALDIPFLAERGGLSPRVLEALGEIPRHEFVPAGARHLAYEDRPLPIGHGRTIPRPLLAAVMAHLADPSLCAKVLEAGAGSGYQSAVLARLAGQVHALETTPELAAQAQANLARVGAFNVMVYVGDASGGLPDQAPFDAIVVSVGAERVPPPLIEQLKPDGIMVIPVGPAWQVQQLTLVRKGQDGGTTSETLMPVAFTPLRLGR